MKNKSSFTCIWLLLSIINPFQPNSKNPNSTILDILYFIMIIFIVNIINIKAPILIKSLLIIMETKHYKSSSLIFLFLLLLSLSSAVSSVTGK